MSANQAVSASRPQVEASNAWLYVELQVGSRFILADDLRRDPALSVPADAVEETAFREAKRLLRKKKRGLSADEVDFAAEQVLDTNTQIWEIARIIEEPI